nr:unnamed protein product [Digitaria exilis]
MVATGALLRRLRWLRTSRCLGDAAPAFPPAAAAAPSRNSAAATTSATRNARAAVMGRHALPNSQLLMGSGSPARGRFFLVDG